MYRKMTSFILTQNINDTYILLNNLWSEGIIFKFNIIEPRHDKTCLWKFEKLHFLQTLSRSLEIVLKLNSGQKDVPFVTIISKSVSC